MIRYVLDTALHLYCTALSVIPVADPILAVWMDPDREVCVPSSTIVLYFLDRERSRDLDFTHHHYRERGIRAVWQR